MKNVVCVPMIKAAFTLVCLNMSLLNSLIDYRQTRSVAERTSPYSIFGDTVLRSISNLSPKTAATDLKMIKGFDFDKYGDDVLDVIWNASGGAPPQQPPDQRKVIVKHAASRLGRSMFHMLTKPNFLTTDDNSIYILELGHGKVYVGRSKCVPRRVKQHLNGEGPLFTRLHPPTGIRLPRLGRVSGQRKKEPSRDVQKTKARMTGSGEAAERDETLRYMYLRGVDNVRGWKYTMPVLTDGERREITENIRELFDLCRRCGHPGHFISQCKAHYDTDGRALDSK